MIEPDDREMAQLTAQIARDVAGLGVALLAAHQVLEQVRTSVPVAATALVGLLPLCADGGATLIKLGGLLDHSVLLPRAAWQRIVDGVHVDAVERPLRLCAPSPRDQRGQEDGVVNDNG